MINDRFKGAPWIVEGTSFNATVCGVGGIGSHLVFMLSRLGFVNLFIIDPDRIEEHNLGGQFFHQKYSDQKAYKTEAVYNTVAQFGVQNVISSDEVKVDEDTEFYHPHIFSCFDNMEARKNAFEAWKRYVGLEDGYGNHPIFIDGRLEAEQLQIFCVTPDKIKDYEQHLFSDDEVQDAPCTFRQTTHVASMIAAYMCAFYTNHITNMLVDSSPRVVPFYFEVFTPLVITDIKV